MLKIWKNIINLNNYKISNTGQILSLKHISVKLLKQSINKDGYLTTHIYNNQKAQTLLMHRLVAQAFLPNPDNKPEVNHKDGNKQNNHIDNLEWCTRSENSKHAFNIGLQKYNGNNTRNKKLTNNEVLTIHGLYLSGYSLRKIGSMYGITHVNISQIVNGEYWKELIGVC